MSTDRAETPASDPYSRLRNAVRSDMIVIEADVARLLVHALGQLAEHTARRNGAAPDWLVAVQRALAEAAATLGPSGRPYGARGSVNPQIPSETMKPDRDWLTTVEAGLELGLRTDTLGLWCRTGRIEARKADGRHYLIHRDEVERYRQRRDERKGCA